MLGDGNCDAACNIAKWNLDNGDWGYCTNVGGNTCNSDKLANEIWDNECMFFYCNFDNFACGSEFWNSDQTCNTAMIDNGFCDSSC